ncbi:MAG: hypothetical protein HYU66_14125 [Armatimonadetes bacterium]|nr:hypothetical protein [Armatimonadota bacterium]
MPRAFIDTNVAVYAVDHQDPDKRARAKRLITDLLNRHQISFWDACILSAAAEAGCAVLYSEDLNAGQWYGAVQVVNPFVE